MTSSIKTIVASLIPSQEQVVLDWSEQLARDLGATVDGVYVRHDSRLATLLYGPGVTAYVSESVMEELKKGDREAEAAARAAFEAARDAARSQFGRFLSVDDAPDAGISRAARSYDLAVTLLPGEPLSVMREELLGRLVLDAGVPVLAAPEDSGRLGPLKTALLAWDSSREAARAMRAAVPLLKRAKQVAIVHLGAVRAGRDPVADATAYLSAHGIAARAARIEPSDRAEGAALLEHARTAEADLIVMGAYGHPRWMEQVFGGATHDVVRRSTAPVLLVH
jgi:nucleotide-binding universal stress UspA family protein